MSQPLTADNYDHTVLVFRDRQAGVTEVYDPATGAYSYNAYCLEKKLLKELYTAEFDFLEDALARINEEFGNWAPESFDTKGCGSCVAKKK
jgi:hypothetical protein